MRREQEAGRFSTLYLNGATIVPPAVNFAGQFRSDFKECESAVFRLRKSIFELVAPSGYPVRQK